MSTDTALTSASTLKAHRIRLPAGPGAAAQARVQVRDAVGAWGLPVDLDDAVLLTSELVSNAVRHGAGRIMLSVRATGAGLRVEVHDASPVLPPSGPAESPGEAVSGRGLVLVAALAADWGAYRCPGGKAVFFTLAPAAGDQAPAPATPAGQQGRRMTDSGAGPGHGERWPGLPLLAEEIAELGLAIGEIAGSGRRDAVMRERLIARLGALRAAIDFTVSRSALDWEAVNRQRDRQRARYETLHPRAPQPPGA